jgi:hypothetical protein
MLAAQRLPEHAARSGSRAGPCSASPSPRSPTAAALLASGTGVPSWAATSVGGALVAWAVADIADRAPTAPTSLAGVARPVAARVRPPGCSDRCWASCSCWWACASWPAPRSRPPSAAPRWWARCASLSPSKTCAPCWCCAASSPRSTPDPRRGSPRRPHPRYPVWHRGLRSVLRWPAQPLARVAIVAVVAGLSIRGVWAGTTPLDRARRAGPVGGRARRRRAARPRGRPPGRTDTFPFPRGELFVQHLPIAFVVSCSVGLVAGWSPPSPGVVGAGGSGADRGGIAAGAARRRGRGGERGAGRARPHRHPRHGDARDRRHPHRVPHGVPAGTRRPRHHTAARRTRVGPRCQRALAGGGLGDHRALVVVVVLVGGWTRFRDDIRRAMAEAADQMSPTKTIERQREERLAEEAREAEALAESRRLAGLDPDPGGSAQARAKARAKAKGRGASPRPAPSAPPAGVQGGTSSKPIGRKRDQT